MGTRSGCDNSTQAERTPRSSASWTTKVRAPPDCPPGPTRRSRITPAGWRSVSRQRGAPGLWLSDNEKDPAARLPSWTQCSPRSPRPDGTQIPGGSLARSERSPRVHRTGSAGPSGRVKGGGARGLATAPPEVAACQAPRSAFHEQASRSGVGSAQTSESGARPDAPLPGPRAPRQRVIPVVHSQPAPARSGGWMTPRRCWCRLGVAANRHQLAPIVARDGRRDLGSEVLRRKAPRPCCTSAGAWVPPPWRRAPRGSGCPAVG
jgi:hypothetical protein